MKESASAWCTARRFALSGRLCNCATTRWGVAGGEASDGVDQSRDISSVFCAGGKYKVALPEDAAGLRLRAVEKASYVHAILAWESPQRLTVIAFMPLATFVGRFQAFFSREIELQENAVRAGPCFRPEMGDTPYRIMAAADDANITTPPAWKSRKVVRGS